MASSGPPIEISLADFIQQLIVCVDLSGHDPDTLIPLHNNGKPFGGLVHPEVGRFIQDTRTWTEEACGDAEHLAACQEKRWYITLIRTEFHSNDLWEVAAALYQWCVNEGEIDGPDLGIKII